LEHNAQNTCRTVRGDQQNLNKQMVEFRNLVLFQYLLYILVKFNTFPRSWKPISQFIAYSIL